jgi:hypothetical protein
MNLRQISTGVFFGLLLVASPSEAATVVSTFTLPEGNTILQVTGAVAGVTGGGTATAATRTLYVFSPDFGDTQPNFQDYPGTSTARNWPYVYVDQSLTVNPGITGNVTTAVDSFGTFVLVNGNPVYQFINDISATSANGNIPTPWFYVQADGTATKSRQAIPTPALLPGLIGFGVAAIRKQKPETV